MSSGPLQSTKIPQDAGTTTGDKTTANATYAATFAADVRMCLVSNPHATLPLYVKIGATNASASDYHHLVPPLWTMDICREAEMRVKIVSVFKPTGWDSTTPTLQVKGLVG